MKPGQESRLGTAAQVVVDLLLACGSLALVAGVVACTLAVPAALGDLNFLRLDRAVGDLGLGLLLCGGGVLCFAGALLVGGWRSGQRVATMPSMPRIPMERGDARRRQELAPRWMLPQAAKSSLSPVSLASVPLPLSPLSPLSPSAPIALASPLTPLEWPALATTAGTRQDGVRVVRARSGEGGYEPGEEAPPEEAPTRARPSKQARGAQGAWGSEGSEGGTGSMLPGEGAGPVRRRTLRKAKHAAKHAARHEAKTQPGPRRARSGAAGWVSGVPRALRTWIGTAGAPAEQEAAGRGEGSQRPQGTTRSALRGGVRRRPARRGPAARRRRTAWR